MQNFCLQLKGKVETEKLQKSYPLFIKTIPVSLRTNLRLISGDRLVFSGTNKDFFSYKIYHYFHSLLKDGKAEIHNRLTTDVRYPTTSDPLMLSGNYLKSTKDLYSHVAALPEETIIRQVHAWCSVGRVYRSVNFALFLDRENEYEMLVMKHFNEKEFTQAGLSNNLGQVSLITDYSRVVGC